MLDEYLRSKGIEWRSTNGESQKLDHQVIQTILEMDEGEMDEEQRAEFIRNEFTKKGDFWIMDSKLFMKKARIAPKEIHIAESLFETVYMRLTKDYRRWYMYHKDSLVREWADGELDGEFKESLVGGHFIKKVFVRDEAVIDIENELDLVLLEFSNVVERKLRIEGHGSELKKRIIALAREVRKESTTPT